MMQRNGAQQVPDNEIQIRNGESPRWAVKTPIVVQNQDPTNALGISN
jgi:hypothetical protein